MKTLQYLIYLIKNYDLIGMTKEDYQESYISYYTNLLWGEISLINQLKRAKTDFIYASRNFPLLKPNQILEHYEEKVSYLTTMLPQKKNFIKKQILTNPPIHPRDEFEMKKMIIVRGYIDYAEYCLTEDEKKEFESYLGLYNVKQYSYHS